MTNRSSITTAAWVDQLRIEEHVGRWFVIDGGQVVATRASHAAAIGVQQACRRHRPEIRGVLGGGTTTRR